MEMYVVRHGRVPSNDKQVIGGRNDEELTEVGVRQAKSVGERLQDIQFDAIFSSPIRRTVQTANIVNTHQLPIYFDDRLMEREPGSLVGKDRNAIDKSTWNSLEVEYTPEGAETLKSGLKRTRSFLDEVHEKYKGKKILIVTHNFICRCIWMLENDETNQEKVNTFFQDNDEIRKYIVPEEK